LVGKGLICKWICKRPTSKKLADGFNLKNAYITAAVRCAPPQNKPLREEFDNCSIFLAEELALMKNVKIIICLEKMAFEATCRILGIKGKKFIHENSFKHRKYQIFCSYHPR